MGRPMRQGRPIHKIRLVPLACYACGGSGWLLSSACGPCSGSGEILGPKTDTLNDIKCNLFRFKAEK